MVRRLFLGVTLFVLAVMVLGGREAVFAQSGDVVLTIDVDRTGVPALFHDELTVVVNAGNFNTARVSHNGITIPHIVQNGQIIATTNAPQLHVEITDVADLNAITVEKAALRDNKKWAWSHGFDDNTFLHASIQEFRNVGWGATIFLIAEYVHDTRDEDWIVDAPLMHTLLTEGWGMGNHTWDHLCYADAGYEANILDGYNRLVEVAQNSPVPDYQITSFAAPCFDANYHPIIQNMRDTETTAVQFNESGEDYRLIVDSASPYSNGGKVADPFNFDMAIGRDYRIESDAYAVQSEMDWMAANASDEHHFWYNTLAHGSHETVIAEVVYYAYHNYGPAGTNEAWVAPSDQIYSYLLVRDGSVLTWTFSATTPPLIEIPSLPNRSNTEGDLISFFIPIVDNGSGSSVTTVAFGLPTGLTMNGETGEINGVLALESAGIYNVRIVASNGSDVAENHFSWAVSEAMTPPVPFTCSPPASTNLTVTNFGTDHQLTWQENGTTVWQVVRGIDPYSMTPDSSVLVSDSLVLDHQVDQAGLSGFFYTVQGQNNCGELSEPSNMVSLFRFDLETGG